MGKPVFYITFILTLFTFLHGAAQENLVYNGSFEEYYSCPDGNDLGDGQLEKCKGWWKPTSGTSDYFNSCSTFMVSVPTNFWGYQEAFSGNGYIGFGAAEWYVSNGQIAGQEYIQTKLQKKLTACKTYHLRFYVSLANRSTYAVGNLGAFFGDQRIDTTTVLALNKIPQIQNNYLVSDTMNWVRIDGDFVASGNEQFLTIGYFRNNIINDTLFIQSYGTSTNASYYYIDSVSVVEIGEAGECDIEIPNIFTPNNDGINDRIDFSYLDGFEELDFRVLNRWGNVVFRYSTNNPIWDGTSQNGEPCTDGVYFYVLNSKNIRKTGFIQLVR